MRIPGTPGWLRIALLATLALAGILAFRAFEFGGRVHANEEPIRPWMTVPYIAHSRHVSQNVLWAALGLPSHLHDHRPIGRIARQQGRPVADVVSALKSAIEHAPAKDTR
jgi:hypothetical protein